MKLLIVILAMIYAGVCHAADSFSTFTLTTHTQTSTVQQTEYSDPFTGEIDEISVYSSAGVTGSVAIAAIDSYSGNALVLATNVAVSEYMVWRPRVMPVSIDGATTLVITNSATEARFNCH